MGKALEEMTLDELKAKGKTLNQQNAMVGAIGGVAGLVYANKTGGGFLRYVGYFLLGGFAVGMLPNFFYFTPQKNKVDAMIKEKSNNLQNG
jgi:hypothetical protein